MKPTIRIRRQRPVVRKMMATAVGLVSLCSVAFAWQAVIHFPINVGQNQVFPCSTAWVQRPNRSPRTHCRIGTLLRAGEDNEGEAIEPESGDKMAGIFEMEEGPDLPFNASLAQVVNGDVQASLTSVVQDLTEPQRDEKSVCRIVAPSDGRLPTEKSALPRWVQQSPDILGKLDAIYHAISHDETRRLRYATERTSPDPNATYSSEDQQEDQKLVSVLRISLEDAGFELLSKRDLDLCEALNAGYLLRLAIAPDVSSFDPGITREFYPEKFGSNSTEDKQDEWWPFEGRVLIYRRGYSTEVTQGRLLVPKLDYLQASIVQRSAYAVAQVLGNVEVQAATFLSKTSRKLQKGIRGYLTSAVDSLSNDNIKSFLRSRLSLTNDGLEKPYVKLGADPFFKLVRYGGVRTRFMGSPSLNEALAPFITCGVKEDAFDFTVNGLPRAAGNLTCEYDASQQANGASLDAFSDSSVLLERASISDVVDLSGREGRRNLLRRFFAVSELVEPTYGEVVTIWRPLPKKRRLKPKPFVIRPPKFAYSVAEILDVDDRLPKLEEPEPEPTLRPLPLEIRAFVDVPMANVPAVLPRTKLLFRPADAFVFDLVTVVSFVIVFSSQRFNSPRLDLLAVVSVSLWTIRTVIRYSNKLARYDLLVKKFLTSKISYRNSGALKYITREAGTQRAIRASLVYMWLIQRLSNTEETVSRSQLIREGALAVNQLLDSNASVRVDVNSALNDLEDLNLIRFGGQDQELHRVSSYDDGIVEILVETWRKVFEGKMTLKTLIWET